MKELYFWIKNFITETLDFMAIIFIAAYLFLTILTIINIIAGNFWLGIILLAIAFLWVESRKKALLTKMRGEKKEREG